MARCIPPSDKAYWLQTPLTLTQMQIVVGGFIQFIELTSGDTMIVNELQDLAPLNVTATAMAKQPVYGTVIVCESEEIA